MLPLPPFHPILAMLTFMGACASYIAAKLAQLNPALDSNDILGSSFLTMMCLAGSLGGATIYIMLFGQNDPRNTLLAKAITCSFSGMIITPFIIRWRNWPEVPSVVLIAAAGVSGVAWMVLIKLIPLLSERVTAWASNVIQAIFGKANKPDNDSK